MCECQNPNYENRSPWVRVKLREVTVLGLIIDLRFGRKERQGHVPKI